MFRTDGSKKPPDEHHLTALPFNRAATLFKK